MARKISVEIVGDASSLERAFKKSSRSAKNFQGDMSKTGTATKRGFSGLTRMAGLATGAIGIAGLAGAARAAVGEFTEMQQVQAQTAAALKSTSNAAGLSAKQIENLASQTLKLTGIDDEAVQSSENLLLTFTNVRGEIFKRTVPAIADLATAMNRGAVPSAEQLQTATMQLGKALNDPVKGLTALRRVGIAFTAQQQDQIKAMVKAGNVVGAQRIILAELNKEVGGRAAAAGKTFAGQMAILREQLLNVAGAIAAVLMPTVQRYLEIAVRWLNNSKNQKAILDTVKAAAAAVSTAVKVLTGAFQALNAITGSTKNTFYLLLGVFTAFKALKLVSYIAGMTRAMRGFASASAAANAAGVGGGVAGGGRFGRALGAVGAVAVGAPLVAKGLRSIPGFDKTFKGLGGKIFDVTHPGMNVQNQVINLHGVQNVPQLENELHKRAKQRHRNVRRGAR